MTNTHTVLVVDDDPEIRSAVRMLLEDEGYRVSVAANGEEALERLRSGAAPCLILLDLMMPVMDGFVFLERHRADPELAGIPIVVVTAAGERRVAGFSAGNVLAKPVRAEKLLGVVNQYC
jgi:CheY-like chemotaxis protein